MSNYKKRIEVDIKNLSDDAVVFWASFMWSRILELYSDLGDVQKVFNDCLLEARDRGITDRIEQSVVTPE